MGRKTAISARSQHPSANASEPDGGAGAGRRVISGSARFPTRGVGFRADPAITPESSRQTLNRNSTTSPSAMT
jgi:hypothetical protein